MDNQMLDIQALRSRVKESRESYPHHWEASRKLMNQASLSTTLPALIQSIEGASLVPSLQKCLVEVVRQFGQQTKTRQMHQTLKRGDGPATF